MTSQKLFLHHIMRTKIPPEVKANAVLPEPELTMGENEIELEAEGTM